MSSLRERIVRETNAQEARSVNHLLDTSEECLATFWRQATPGVTYWRAEVPARYLPAQVIGFDMDRVGWDDAADQVTLEGHRGTAIWAYLGDDVRARIAFGLRDTGVPTFMEMDDNYAYSPRKWGNNWAQTHEQAEKYLTGYSHEQHRHLCGLADGIIVSTEWLADVYDEFNDNVHVCRNAVDPQDWPAYEKPDDGIFRIVYAGSAVHIFEYPIIKKALKWAMRQKDVEVTLMGFARPPAFTGEVIQWTDSLEDYRKTLGRFDLGLAPLVKNNWNNGKSDIKAMEYALMGIMPIVSRTEPYRPWTDRGWPSAQSPEDWVEVVQYAVRNRDWVKEQAKAALDYTLTERVAWKEVTAWREAIQSA